MQQNKAEDHGSQQVVHEVAHQIAQRVMRQEGEALVAMAEAIPADFDAVVGLILQSAGRVVVSGMGKSGHIGHKIAATLASTGTPAFFVHPAEGQPWRSGHGDTP